MYAEALLYSMHKQHPFRDIMKALLGQLAVHAAFCAIVIGVYKVASDYYAAATDSDYIANRSFSEIPEGLRGIVERAVTQENDSSRYAEARVCYRDPDQTEVLYDYLVNGLPKRSIFSRQKKVVVVGAGISGLVAAQLLKDAGHEIIVLEASNRVGGRIQTFRDVRDGWKTEVGPMRYPHHHRFTKHLVEKFGLKTSLFLNEKANDYYFIRGKLSKLNSIGHINHEFFNKQYELLPGEEKKFPAELFHDAMKKPMEDFYKMDFSAFLAKYDRYSLKDYLLEHRKLSVGAVEIIGVFSNLEAFLNKALIEVVMEDCVNSDTELRKLDGGMDLIPRGFLPALGLEIKYEAMVTKITQNMGQGQGGLVVEASCHGVHCYDIGKDHVADHVIVTPTARVVRGIQFEPMLSQNKSLAIRSAHYMSSTKVILIFRSQWWVKPGQHKYLGGQVISDLGFKTIYYPTEKNKNGYGILLASYTWGDDSNRTLGMKDDEIFDEMMEGLATIHRKTFEEVRKHFMKGVVKDWALEHNYLGAFAGFHNFEMSQFQEELSLPEGQGHIHFAGEHTDTPHGWMDTAIRTGVRSAAEVHLGVEWDSFLKNPTKTKTTPK